jgi:hypothetical protein
MEVAILAAEERMKGAWAMGIRLSQETVVELFCHCREAERSVHRALGDCWQDFRQYYSEPKRRAIMTVIEALNGVTGRQRPAAVGDASVGREPLIPRLGLLRFLCGRWIAPWKRAWTFGEAEAHFIAATLRSLLALLDSPARPDADALIGLRMRLCCCEFIIEARSFGLAVIERAKGIDHFNKTEGLPSETLAAILKDCA